jgi:cell volume regulation protein A
MVGLGPINAVILLGAALVLAGILSSLVARRFGAPLLFLFLAIGMLAGEDGPGGIAFNDYRATYLVGSVALAIILFDGGLRTKLARFRGVVAPALLLATVGVVVTAVLVAVVARWVLGLGWHEGLLLGAIVASTDAAAVFFLLHAGGLQLRPRVGSVLEIESGTNDPIAVFLVVLLTEVVLAGGDLTFEALGLLAAQGLIGAAFGLAGGFALVWVLNRLEFPVGLHALTAGAGAVFIYALATLLEGSGFLAVYLAGLVVGNRPVRAFPAILSFHVAATWLCQIVMFLVLGLLVTPTHIVPFALPALAIALFLAFVARPAAVALCLAPFRFGAREIGFVTWVGLRGAVSIFLAAIPTLAAVPNAAAFFNVAFFVVIVSLLVQGWTIRPIARWLGVALSQAEPAVTRVELDLPGQLGHEMVGYPIRPGSIVLTRDRLPEGVRLVLVAREGAVLDAAEAGRLKAGDYAYVLAAPERVHRLDRLFAEPGSSRAAADAFSINGSASVGALARLYGLTVDARESRLAVADLFAARLEDTPEPGDAIDLGSVVLVARLVEGGRVKRAALLLPDALPLEAGMLRLRHVIHDVVERALRRRRTRKSS